MQILAIAGGALSSDEEALYTCGVFLILPLIVFLSGLAIYRNSVVVALGAVLLVGLPYLLLRHMVGRYHKSIDADVMDDQAFGRKAAVLYLCLLAVPLLALLGIAIRRLLGWNRKHAELDGPANGSQPSRSDTNRTSGAAGSRR